MMKFDLINDEYNNGFLQVVKYGITFAFISYDSEFKTWTIIYEKGCKKFKGVISKFLKGKGFKDIKDITKFN